MFKRTDRIIIAVIAVMVLCSCIIYFLPRHKGKTVQIKQNNELVYSYPLNENRTVELDNNVIEIKNGKVFMKSAECRDRICVKTGEISNTGQSIICLPNRVSITVTED